MTHNDNRPPMIDLAKGGVEQPPDWPLPLTFSTQSVPEPFPLCDALPAPLAELADAVASAIKVSLTAPAVLIPAMLSAAVGNAYSVRVSRAHVEPNLSRFAVWAAPSGERKSATFRAVDAPLTTWIGDAMPKYQAALAAYRSDATFFERVAAGYEKRAADPKHAADMEQLRANAREAREKIPPVPRKPNFVVGDTTPAQLVRMMHDAGGAGAVFSADGRATIEIIAGCFRGDGSADDAVFLKAHGGDVIDRARAGNSPDGEFLRIERPALAVALAVQPDKIASIAGNGNLAESGFVARLNLCQPESLVGDRIETGDEQPIGELLRVGWRNIAHAILTERFRIIDGEQWRPVELCFSREAMALRREFANAIEREQRQDGVLANHCDTASKTAGEAARLAALFHLAAVAERGEIHDADRIEISADTWRIAEFHQRWQLTETLRVLGLARESAEIRRAKAVLVWAKRHPEKCQPLALRDLVRAGCGGIKDTADAEIIMAVLQENGWVRLATANSGETSPRYQFHPATFGQGVMQ